jgi:hypothetical protein
MRRDDYGKPRGEVQRFGGDLGGGGEGGRPLWRDAPSLFHGSESVNIEHQSNQESALFFEPKDLVRTEPPSGLNLPSEAEIARTLEKERMSPLRTESMSRAEQKKYEAFLEFEREIKRKAKENGP